MSHWFVRRVPVVVVVWCRSAASPPRRRRPRARPGPRVRDVGVSAVSYGSRSPRAPSASSSGRGRRRACTLPGTRTSRLGGYGLVASKRRPSSRRQHARPALHATSPASPNRALPTVTLSPGGAIASSGSSATDEPHEMASATVALHRLDVMYASMTGSHAETPRRAGARRGLRLVRAGHGLPVVAGERGRTAVPARAHVRRARLGRRARQCSGTRSPSNSGTPDSSRTNVMIAPTPKNPRPTRTRPRSRAAWPREPSRRKTCCAAKLRAVTLTAIVFSSAVPDRGADLLGGVDERRGRPGVAAGDPRGRAGRRRRQDEAEAQAGHDQAGQHVAQVVGLGVSGEQDHAQHREDHADGHEGARARPREQARARHRRRDPERDHEGQEVDPGAQGRVVERVLQVVGEEQRQREDAEAGDEEGDLRSPARALQEQAHRQQRVGGAALAHDEQPERGDPQGEAPPGRLVARVSLTAWAKPKTTKKRPALPSTVPRTSRRARRSPRERPRA